MFKIGEFSKLTQVSIRMLRYYNQTGLLKPAEISASTGYRLYSAQELERLNRIIFLRDLGFNVAEIRLALQDWSEQYIEQLLDRRRLSIEADLHSQEERLARIKQANIDIKQHRLTVNNSVTLKTIPAYPVLSLRRIIADYYREAELWQALTAYTQADPTNLTGETLTIYHDSDYREKDVDVQICIVVKQIKRNQGEFTYLYTPAVETMATMLVNGPFSAIAPAYRSLADWLINRDCYKITGTSRQILHRGPHNESDPQNYLIEIQIPLEKQ